MTYTHRQGHHGRGPTISPAVRADIIRTMDNERIVDQARRLGISPSAVGKIRRTNADPATRTLRAEIVHLLELNGPYADAEALLHDIRLADTHRRWSGIDLHSLQHQLGAMNRIALIAYRRRRVGSINRLTDIRVRPPKRTNGGTTPPPADEPFTGNHAVMVQDIGPDGVTVVDPIADIRNPWVDPAPAWPVLDALRARVDASVAERARADALVAAAEGLSAVDAAMADLLLERAAGVDVDPLTPAEAEYLRYAADHDGGAA